MDTLIAALIAAPVVFFFVWRYMKNQAPARRSAAAVPTTLDPYSSSAPAGMPVSDGRPIAAAPAIAAPDPVAAMPRRLHIPGEDLGKVAHRLAEVEKYSDADILVVGGGDSAVEAALALCRSGKNRVTVAYRGAEFTRPRDANREQFLGAEREGRVTVLRNTRLLGIKPEGVLLDHGGKIREIPNRFVFVLIGAASPAESGSLSRSRNCPPGSRRRYDCGNIEVAR